MFNFASKKTKANNKTKGYEKIYLSADNARCHGCIS